MPTKAKAKPRKQSSVAKVKIADKHREQIAECLGLNITVDSQELRLARFILNLERHLATCAAKLAEISDFPMPSNLIAELEPIKKALSELTERLHPDRITTQARNALSGCAAPYHPPSSTNAPSVSVALLWNELNKLHSNAAKAIAALKKRRTSRGLLHQIEADYRKKVDASLIRLFDASALDAEKDDRSEFLGICRRYLDAMPSPPSRRDPDTSQLPFVATMTIEGVEVALTRDG